MEPSTHSVSKAPAWVKNVSPEQAYLAGYDDGIDSIEGQLSTLQRANAASPFETEIELADRIKELEEQFDALRHAATCTRDGEGWTETRGCPVHDDTLAHRQGETIHRMTVQIATLRHALETVRAECELPDYIAEFIGEALEESLSPSSPNVRKSWGPERMRHDPERA